VSLFLLDTDHLTLYQMGHPRLLQNVARHLADQLAISVITVEEQLTGWQRALRQARDDARRERVYERMARTVESLAG
jgi:tRNA(fMet)-specific endonuclease VapC